MRKSSYVFIFFLFITSSSYAAEPKKISLQVGEYQEIKSIEGLDFKVSRRGLVQLVFLAPGKWRIIALKAGFVVLNQEDYLSHETLQYFVTVHKEKIEDRKDILGNFCSKYQTLCSRDHRVLIGELDDFSIFKKIKSFCVNKRNKCRAYLTLSKNAIESYEKLLHDYLNPYIFKVKKKMVIFACFVLVEISIRLISIAVSMFQNHYQILLERNNIVFTVFDL